MIDLFGEYGGSDGTRTRGLRRDRPGGNVGILRVFPNKSLKKRVENP